MSRSEIAQLREQIELELVAMRRGLYAVSEGQARHAFINAKMERIGTCQDRLAHHVGEKKANHIVYELYVEAMDTEKSPV
jgi:hypothetical protein